MNYKKNVGMFTKLNRFVSESNTGFSNDSKDSGGRFYTKDGIANVKKIGLTYWDRTSWYHTLLDMPTSHFLGLILLCYVSVNFIFTGIYFILGIDNLIGIARDDLITEVMDTFFFSTQTFTTVGYGRISPAGMATSAVATFEAFIGLLSFAIATGLFYARFSKPEAHLKFTKSILISPYQGQRALMFRVAPFKNNQLSYMKVKMTLAIREDEIGIYSNQFFQLVPALETVNLLPLSWTIVHVLDEKSPLAEFDDVALQALRFEILVYLSGYDEAYASQIVARTSYLNSDLVPMAKFTKMYKADERHQTTILDFSLFDTYHRVETYD